MASVSSSDHRSSAGRTRDRAAQRAVLANNWWVVALRGVCALLFGVIALMIPGAAMLSMVLVFGAYMLVDGVLAIISAVRAARRHERWGVFVLQGVLNLAAAAVTVLTPGVTVLVFVAIVAVWSLISGAFSIAAAVRLKRDHGGIWIALGGAASIVLGVLLLLAPMIGAVVLTWWIGAFAIVLGVTYLVLAFRLRKRKGGAVA